MTSVLIQSGNNSLGIKLGAGGTVINAGTVDGAAAGVALGANGVVANLGSIIGSGGDGVDTGTSGNLTNAASAIITGQAAGVSVGTTSIIDNFGIISGMGSDGADFTNHGTLINAASGTITGAADGLESGSTTTVLNSGVITGTAIDGVDLGAKGSVINFGTVNGQDTAVSETANGVLTNSGLINGTLVDGVELGANGTISNSGYGTIYGGIAGVAEGANGSVINAGIIAGIGDAGVTLGAGGAVSNNVGATISGGLVGITGSAGGVVTNFGNIAGTTGDGISLANGGTVINGGTIAGGDGIAVRLGGTGSNLLAVDPGAVFDGKVVVGAQADNTLELGAGTGTIANFDTGFQNFQSITVDAGANWTVTVANAADLARAEAIASNVAAGSTLDFVLADNAPCFCAGTRIGTSEGDVAVETLAIGDLVVTASGELRPVRWIGQRSFSETVAAGNTKILPIRIQAGAVEEGIPRRDLFLSPDHAIFMDGMLICARQLANGTTIRQEARRQNVHYFHVELDAHAILLAEGLPAESFLNTGNRGLFSNAADPLVLYPDLTLGDDNATREIASCAPFVWDSDRVQPVWQHLADRAVRLGYPAAAPNTTTDPALHLMAMGKKLHQVTAGPGRFIFSLPHAAAKVWLVSRASSPSEVSPWLDDRRCLGVQITRLVLRSQTESIDIPIDHPGLSIGWWAVEQHGPALHRWTNGEALLPLPPFHGPALLEVHLGGEMTYGVAASPEPEILQSVA